MGIALNAIKSDKFLIYGTDQSGHVVGDDYDKELTELERVTKSDGWILDCPGEDDRKGIPKQEMLKRGFEYFYYVGKTGGDIYRYRKQVIK